MYSRKQRRFLSLTSVEVEQLEFDMQSWTERYVLHNGERTESMQENYHLMTLELPFVPALHASSLSSSYKILSF